MFYHMIFNRKAGHALLYRLAALMLMLLLVTVSFGSALAEDTVSLIVDTVEGEKGGQVTVTVHAADMKGLDSIQFSLNYDSASLRLAKDPVAGEVLSDGMAFSNVEKAGLVVFAYAGAEGIDGAGTLLTLTFDVLNEKSTPILLTDVLVSAVDEALVQKKAYVTLENGGVTVGGKTMADPVVTPWPVETPAPTPTPTPEPTPEPTPVPSIEAQPVEAAAATPQPTAAAAPVEQGSSSFLSEYGIFLAAGVLVLALLVTIIILATRMGKKPRKKNRSSRRG